MKKSFLPILAIGLALARQGFAVIAETNTFDNLKLSDGQALTDSDKWEAPLTSHPTMCYSTNAHAVSAPGCVRFKDTREPARAYHSLDFLGAGQSNGTLIVEARMKVTGTHVYDTVCLAVHGKDVLRDEGGDGDTTSLLTMSVYWPETNDVISVGFSAVGTDPKKTVGKAVKSRRAQWDVVRLTIDFVGKTALAEVQRNAEMEWTQIAEEDIMDVLSSAHAVSIWGVDCGTPSGGSYLDDLVIRSYYTAPNPVKKKSGAALPGRFVLPWLATGGFDFPACLCEHGPR